MERQTHRNKKSKKGSGLSANQHKSTRNTGPATHRPSHLQACRHAQTQIDRQENTHRAADRPSQTWTNRQTETQTDRQADRQTGRQTGRQAGRQTDRLTDRQTDRQTDRLTQVGNQNTEVNKQLADMPGRCAVSSFHRTGLGRADRASAMACNSSPFSLARVPMEM
jgi:hypothetical protein